MIFYRSKQSRCSALGWLPAVDQLNFVYDVMFSPREGLWMVWFVGCCLVSRLCDVSWRDCGLHICIYVGRYVPIAKQSQYKQHRHNHGGVVSLFIISFGWFILRVVLLHGIGTLWIFTYVAYVCEMWVRGCLIVWLTYGTRISTGICICLV